MKRVFLLGLLLMGCDSVRYQGRTLDSWAFDLDSTVAHERANALKALGAAAHGVSTVPVTVSRALPKMAKLLGDADPSVQEQARYSLMAVGAPARDVLEKALRQPQPTVRTQAAAALVNLELTHDVAARVLVEMLLNRAYPELAALAEEELVALGPFAAIPLAERLPERKVIQTLGALEEAGRDYAPALLRIAREDTDLTTRLAAMKAYARVVDVSQANRTLDVLRQDENIRFARSAGALMRRYPAPETTVD